MSRKTRDLIRFFAVTDHDTAMYHMGEIDWQYSEDVLSEHVKQYGADELLEALSFMQHCVWTTKLALVAAEMAVGTNDS